MKVKATGEFKKLGIYPIELGFIPVAGEEFEVSEERYEILKGNNAYKVKFVEAAEEPITIVETAVKEEPKKEKAVKKTTTKKKK